MIFKKLEELFFEIGIQKISGNYLRKEGDIIVIRVIKSDWDFDKEGCEARINKKYLINKK